MACAKRLKLARNATLTTTSLVCYFPLAPDDAESSTNDRFLNSLNCWLTVFEHLEFAARIRCESVSKRLARLFVPLWRAQNTLDANVLARSADATLEICSRIDESLRILYMNEHFPLLHAIDFRTIATECPNLTTLDFHASPDEPISFEQFDKLVVLHLHDVTEGVSFSTIPRTLEVLTGIEFGAVALEYRNAASISNLPGGATPESVKEFILHHPRLKRIDFSYHRNFGRNFFDGLEVEPIFYFFAKACPHLTCITLVGTDCDRRVLKGVELLSGLVELRLNSARKGEKACLRDEQMIAVCAQNPTVETLCVLNRSGLLKLRAFEAIGKLRCLREFHVGGYGSGEFNDECVRLVIDGCALTLRCLRFGYVPLISDASLDYIGVHCTELRSFYIEVSNSMTVTAVGVRRLIDAVAALNPHMNGDWFVVDVRVAGKVLATFGELNTAQLPDGVKVSVEIVSSCPVIASE